MDEILSLITMVIAVIVIIALSYVVSRKLGASMTIGSASKNIRVIDRVLVGREESIVIVRVGKKDYLLGVSSQNINLLSVLEEEQVVYEEKPNDKILKHMDFNEIFKLKSKEKK